MPEHIRAMIVILGLLTITMAVIRKPTLLLGVDSKDYIRRCLSWLWITAAAFLANNFWLFLLAAAVWLWLAAKSDPSSPALYLFLLFALPPFSASIPGFGGLEQIFELSYSRLLSFIVLLPAFVTLVRVSRSSHHSFGVVDWLIVAYVTLGFTLQLSVDTFTNTLRHGLYTFLDVLLPYFLLSRTVVTLEARRQVFLAFMMAMFMIAPIAVFEFFKGWLLYTSLPEALGIPPQLIPAYISRGENIRAVASSGQPIVLGYMMTVAIMLFSVVGRAGLKAKYFIFGLAILSAGVVVPISRGPWVGLVAGMLLILLTSPNPRGWLVTLAVGLVVALPVLTMTSVGPVIVDYLPFVGTVDSGNVDYRSILIDVALQIIWVNPWFGSFDFLHNSAWRALVPEGGQVDLTNTFAGVALSYGLVGLMMFVGIFFFASVQLLGALKKLDRRDVELFSQGRVLLAAIGATVVTIGTVSSISFVPHIYWCLCGLAVGYSRLVCAESFSSRSQDRSRIARR